MKKAFIVTSAIEISTEPALSYCETRNCFTKEERLAQTIETIANIDFHSKDDTVIYLLDISTDCEFYKNLFSYQHNLKYINVKDEFPEIFHIVRTHPNKGFCETTITKAFFKKYYNELIEFDYFFKISGRYGVEESFNTDICNTENLNKMFFKKSCDIGWSDDYNYTFLDDGIRIQSMAVCTVIFGWGRCYLDKMIDIYTVANYFLYTIKNNNISMEQSLHRLTRPYDDDIIETYWIIYGRGGCNGEYFRY